MGNSKWCARTSWPPNGCRPAALLPEREDWLPELPSRRPFFPLGKIADRFLSSSASYAQSGSDLGRGLGCKSLGTWRAECCLSKCVALCYEGGGGFRDDRRRSCAGGRPARRRRSLLNHRASSQKFQGPPPFPIRRRRSARCGPRRPPLPPAFARAISHTPSPNSCPQFGVRGPVLRRCPTNSFRGWSKPDIRVHGR